MKKILSLVLAVFMLVGLMCSIPASAAETLNITGQDTARLEFEDYVNDFKCADGSAAANASWVISNALLSGSKAICTGAGPLQEVSLTVPVNVTDAGTYDVEAALTFAGHLSTLVLYLDDTEVKTFDSAGAALPNDNGSFYFGAKDYVGYKYNFQMDFNEGAHNLKLVAKMRAAQFNGGTIAFGADYMTFKNINAASDALTVTGLDTVRLEFEDYATDIKGADGSAAGGSGWILSNTFMSGGKGLRTGGGPKQDISITIPIDVKIGGTFELEAVVSYASWLSTVSLQLDGTTVKTFDSSGKALPCSEDNFYFSAGDWPGYQYVFEVDIPAGRHDLKLHIKQRATQFNGGDTAFAADYLQLKNLSAASEAEISATDSTVLELEDYVYNTLAGGEGYADAKVILHEKASGGKLYAITEEELENVEILVPVNVEKTGVYDLDTIMSYSATDDTSVVKFYVDGNPENYNRYYQREAVSELDVDANYPMHHFYRRVYLSEGVHTFKFTAAPAKNDGKVKFMIDALTVTPAEALVLSDSATAEFEDYADIVNSAGKANHGKNQTDPNTASGGDYIYSYSAGADDASLILPLSVPETGLYNVEYVVAAAGHLSPINAFLDGEKVAFQTNKVDGTALDTEDTGYFHSKTNLPAKMFTFPIYLTAGDHAITFRIPARLAGTEMSVAYAMDYISFTKQEAEVVAEDGLTIELENYKDKVLASGNVKGNGVDYQDMQYTSGVLESEFASGGAMLNMSERTNLFRAKIYIPITAEADGWYDVEWIITNADQGVYLSLTTLSLDGKKLVVNDKESMVEDVSKYDDAGDVTYPAKWYPMGKYKAQIELTAGNHMLAMDAQELTQVVDGRRGVKFFADSITLTPITGLLGSGTTFTESADHTGADWKFDLIAAGVEGTLNGYIASYSGNKLVSVEKTPLNYVSGQNNFSGKAVAAPGVDSLKFFVWDDNGKPYANTKPISFVPVNENPFEGDDVINVVYIGDSIYEGAGASSSSTKWVARVGAWFEETYEKDGVQVNNYYEGVGGTTTDYSLVRMFRDVIEHDPDVVFYSCSCNDIGDTRRNMESFLLTLMNLDHVPYVIFNRTTNRSFSTTNGRGDQIAAHYGIPFVDDYYAFKRAVAESGDEIATYFSSDGVHPNDKGYKVIADEMIACVSSGRYLRKPVDPGTRIITNSVTMESASFIPTTSSAVTKTGSWTTGGSGERTWVRTNKIGDTLEFDFTGNFLAFEHGLHKNSGKYEVYVDGVLAMTCNPYYNGITSYQLVCKNDTTNLDLPDGDHHVVVKTIESSSTTEADYTVHIYNIIAGNVKR